MNQKDENAREVKSFNICDFLLMQKKRFDSFLKEEVREDRLSFNVLDTHVGIFVNYSDFLSAHEKGTGYSPIMYHIKELKKKGKFMETLETLEQRLAYLLLLEKQISYIYKRFDWKKIKSIFLYFTNLLETFCLHILHILDLVAKYAYAIDNKNEELEENVNYTMLYDEYIKEMDPMVERFLNPLLGYCLIQVIRNNIVHSGRKILRKNDLEIKVISREFPKKIIHKRLEKWIFDSFELAKKHGVKFAKNEIQNIPEPRFPHFIINGKVTKDGQNINFNETSVSFEMEILEFLNYMANTLFSFMDQLLKKARGIEQHIPIDPSKELITDLSIYSSIREISIQLGKEAKTLPILSWGTAEELKKIYPEFFDLPLKDIEVYVLLDMTKEQFEWFMLESITNIRNRKIQVSIKSQLFECGFNKIFPSKVFLDALSSSKVILSTSTLHEI